MLDTMLQTRPDSRPDSMGLWCIRDRRRLLHRNATKFYSVVVDSIPHNSTEAIVKAMLEEAVAFDMNLLSRKTARSHEGNVDVGPPGSMDDSSMVLIEIGVDVDEGHCPNMTILLGIVAEIKKNSTHHQDQSMEKLATRERGVHFHTLEDRDEKALQECG